MQYLQEAFRTITLKKMHLWKEDAVCIANELIDDLSAKDQRIQRALYRQHLYAKYALACRDAKKDLPWKEGMPFLACPLQRIFKPRFYAEHGILRNASILRDFISGQKTDSFDIVDQPVRVFLYFCKA